MKVKRVVIRDDLSLGASRAYIIYRHVEQIAALSENSLYRMIAL